MASTTTLNSDALKSMMKGMDPRVFKKLMEQQLESLRSGKSGLPDSWAFGKPLTEEEFKKLKASEGASVIKTIKNTDKEVSQSANKVEGTIEEILERVRAEKAKSYNSGDTTNADKASADPETLRQKLRARLHAKQATRMSKFAVSSMVTKKLAKTNATDADAASSTNNAHVCDGEYEHDEAMISENVTVEDIDESPQMIVGNAST